MKAPVFDHLMKAHAAAREHAARLIRRCANDAAFIRAFSVSSGIPQSGLRLILERLEARSIFVDRREGTVSVRETYHSAGFWLEFAFKDLADEASLARWLKRKTRKLTTTDMNQLLRDELHARRHGRVMARLRKGDRAQVIARADACEGKGPSGGAS